VTVRADEVGVLLLSFGGPDGPDEVLPFLRRVTEGRGVPEERLRAVAAHYHAFGGVSPINSQTRRLHAGLAEALRDTGTPVFWGNRHASPFLTDVLRAMVATGIGRVVAVPTSAYGGFSACRQYTEALHLACRELGDDAPEVVKLGHYFTEPGFVTPYAEKVQEAVGSIPQARHATTRLLFTAHSIPTAADLDWGPANYSLQVLQASAAVAEAAAIGVPWSVVWQSRSGSRRTPWLEPDILHHLEVLAADEVSDVVICPVGFVSDHMEVVWDLDREAATVSRSRGIAFHRVATPGTHPAFVRMLRDLVNRWRGRTWTGRRGEVHAVAAGETVLTGRSCCIPRRRRFHEGSVEK
jgi:ferrochelatase